VWPLGPFSRLPLALHLDVTVTFDLHLAERFEAVLSSVNAAITRAWAPGLSDEQIDAAVAPFGLDLPEEARAWWRWHNGVRPEVRGPDWDLVPSRPLLDLATSVEECADGQPYMNGPDGSFELLRPVADRPYISFDCSGDHRAPVPVYTSDHAAPQRLALPSIGELVLVWIDLIEQGIWTTNPDGIWTYPPFEALPERVRQLGVY
jgi:hypothetical protein